MHVLVYYDEPQRRLAQKTVELLAKKFSFDLDLLLTTFPPNLDRWTKIVDGKVMTLRATGPFSQAIIQACTATSYDLVIPAPNDRQGLLRMLLGSRIGRFVGSAPATVWVPRGKATQLRRIVVGLSGGPQSEQDARFAARLAVAYDARLELVHAVSQLSLFYTTVDEFQRALEGHEEIAAVLPGVVELRRIRNLLKDEGIAVEMTVRSGAVLDVLTSVCNGEGGKRAADLLVIGAHAQDAVGGHYLENLAEKITEAVDCPTLVVHAHSDWAEWKRI